MFIAQGIKRPRDDDNSEGNFKNSTSAPAPRSAPPAAAAPSTVADTQEAVGHSYAALTQLVTLLHAKVPALRFDVDLASGCAAVLAAAIADASKAATLGQNVAAAATKPLVSQVEALRVENDELRRRVSQQAEELESFKDMARCLETVCHATSRSKAKKGDHEGTVMCEDSPQAKPRDDAARAPDTPPWFEPSLDLPFALPSIPEINLGRKGTPSGSEDDGNDDNAKEDHDEELPAAEEAHSSGTGEDIGEILVRDLKFNGFDAICARYAEQQAGVSASSCDSYVACESAPAAFSSLTRGASVASLSGYESATLGAGPWGSWGGA